MKSPYRTGWYGTTSSILHPNSCMWVWRSWSNQFLSSSLTSRSWNTLQLSWYQSCNSHPAPQDGGKDLLLAGVLHFSEGQEFEVACEALSDGVPAATRRAHGTCNLEWRIYTIDSCWYRQLIPLTHAQNARVSLPSAVVCAVCSSAAFWSDVADARQQHRRLSSPLVHWSRLGVSRP